MTNIVSPEEELDIGPSPSLQEPLKKKRKAVPHEKLFLDQLPSTALYEKSYMHRDFVCHTIVTKTDYIITTSIDGHLKFWKKTDTGIEFVKHFRAHRDMVNMISISFVPERVCWVFQPGSPHFTLAISDSNSGEIHLLDGKGSGEILHTVQLHKSPVIVLKYNDLYNTVISIDQSGRMEYWVPEPPFPLPYASIKWEYKSDTDLFTFQKTQKVPGNLTFSPDFQWFVTYGLQDRQVRVWKFRSATLFRQYDESLSVISEMQHAGTATVQLDDMEFGRRMAVERDLEAHPHWSKAMHAVFDRSNQFVLYPTLMGIKVVNFTTNQVKRWIGHVETLRFLSLALYQGTSHTKKRRTMAMATATNTVLQETEVPDPTLICTAYKKNRFYLFTVRDPSHGQSNEDALSGGGRDVLNEKPTKEEQTVAMIKPTNKAVAVHQVTLHTTVGDIVIKLYPDHTPKTVENFVVHARNNYYNGHLFHRVIRGFMIQTGDPQGDGTGGESIWGGEFEDEIVSELKHDRPGTVSMANAGPNTNGSQFFITVAPTPWLDNKHTVFGRVISGMDIVQVIENTPADKNDKPLRDISIVNITLQKNN
ncbi:hypothetical protein HMI55_002279 [Coelomomyces lativittatus]|nr:hypothetical protein HMI55_002279 [Coelomomyces lativittatus]